MRWLSLFRYLLHSLVFVSFFIKFTFNPQWFQVKIPLVSQGFLGISFVFYRDHRKPTAWEEKQRRHSNNPIQSHWLMVGQQTKPTPPSFFDPTRTIGTNCMYRMVIVLPSMHKEMLRKIHANHFRTQSNIRMTRQEWGSVMSAAPALNMAKLHQPNQSSLY